MLANEMRNQRNALTAALDELKAVRLSLYSAAGSILVGIIVYLATKA